MNEAIVLDGKALATSLLRDIREELATNKGVRPPGLAFVLVGNNLASQTYVKMKEKRAREIGFYSEKVELDVSTTTEQLVDLIHKLNNTPSLDGIIVQQPLPSHIDLHAVLSAVDPKKDIDGFHPVNLGKLTAADGSGFTPCTPKGIAKLLDHYSIDLDRKHVVIVGRSLIVGKSLALLLSQKKRGLNATVTLAHSGTENLPSLTKRADVIVTAVGSPGLLTADMVKPGAVVVDVGVTKIDSGQIVGDVDYQSVRTIASHITPVPGGIGPMTIAMLLTNTYEAYKCND